MARWGLQALALAGTLFSALTLHAQSPELLSVVFAVTVNSEPKGDYFLFLTNDGDFLMKRSDLEEMGIHDAKGDILEVEGEDYLSLKSVPQLQLQFDEALLELNIVSDPSLLAKTLVDLGPQRRPDVLKPDDNSAFFNYGLTYADGDTGVGTLGVAAELGVRRSGWLFLSDFASVTDSNRGGWGNPVRLMTSLTRDSRDDLRRLTFGDFFASSGVLGSTLALGGMSYSKRYSIDPYLIRQPMAAFVGAVSFPSELEVSLDGVRLRSETLPPGEFRVENLNYYGGLHNIDVVLRGPFGDEYRLDASFYFTDALLRAGLHEYSYNLGWLRQDSNRSSFRYSGLAASAFHRYGVNDRLTVGLSGEASANGANLGPQTALGLKNFGVLSARLSVSAGPDGGGWAAQFGYGYQASGFNAGAFVRGFSKNYVLVGTDPRDQRPKLDASVWLGYGNPRLGNFGLSYNVSSRYQGIAERAASTTEALYPDRNAISFTYSRSLFRKLNLFATLSHSADDTHGTELFFGLSWYPGKKTTVGYTHQQRAAGLTDTLQANREVPVGKGWGYRMALERSATGQGSVDRFAPYLRYNGSFGTYAVDYSSTTLDSGGRAAIYSISAAGALAYVDGTLGFSRPVEDSFGLVRVSSLKGVRVLQSNQEVGRTNAKGEIFVPNMSSYLDNQVSIADADVPIDYQLAEKELFVSPGLRSGSLISFDVTRIQAFIGVLMIRGPGEEAIPAENYEFTLESDGELLDFPTGKGGELYVENLEPGNYPAFLVYREGTCAFDLPIPESKETIVDLGEIICEPFY